MCAPDSMSGDGSRAPGASERLTTCVEQRLRSCGYFALRNLEVTELDGRVYLAGRVRTYYMKQLAQSLAMSVPGVGAVTNAVDVQ